MPIFNQHSTGAAPHKNTCARVIGVLQIRLHCGLFGTIAAAEPARAAALLAINGIARYHSRRVAKRFTAIAEQLILLIVRAILLIDRNALLHSRKAGLQCSPGEAVLQSRTLLPLVQHLSRSAQRSHPIYNRASTQSAASQDDHTQVFRGKRATLQKEFGRGLRLLQGEVCLVIIAAFFQHHDTFSGLRQFARNQSPTGTRTNNYYIGLQRGIFGDHYWLNWLGSIDRRGRRCGIIQHFPIRIDAFSIRYGKIDKGRQSLDGLVALSQLAHWTVGHGAQVLLAFLLRERFERTRTCGQQ